MLRLGPIMFDLEFEKVIPTPEQVDVLFQLLNGRDHGISHKAEVPFDQHKTFVETHPYRGWYLVKDIDGYGGSFYVTHDNTIGINISNPESEQAVGKIIEYATEHYDALPPIPSVRGATFAINVPPSNKALIDTLQSLGCELVQMTFRVPR